MGFYLNSAGAHEMFCDDCAGTYYVDKSAILNDLVPIVEMGENLAVAAGANVDEVKEPVGLMVADLPVPAKVQDYAATSMELRTRDEIFSAMVVYGFLNYSDGCVSIPNRELMGKFSEMVKKEASLGSVYQLAKESERMLRATKAGIYRARSRSGHCLSQERYGKAA